LSLLVPTHNYSIVYSVISPIRKVSASWIDSHSSSQVLLSFEDIYSPYLEIDTPFLIIED